MLSRASSLVVKLAGKFRQEAVHRNGRASEQLWEQLINIAAFAGRVVFLQIEQCIDLPRWHALLEHGFTLQPTTGYYRGKPEKSIVLEIVEVQQSEVTALANAIRRLNGQKSVLIMGLTGKAKKVKR